MNQKTFFKACFLACIIIVSLTNCKSDNLSNGWKPNGNIYSYTDTVYEAKENFGDAAKGKMQFVEKHFLDEQNRDSLVITYEPTGEEEHRTNYYYDTDGNLTKEIMFSHHEHDDDLFGKSINEETETTIYEYRTDNGKLKERKNTTYTKWYSEGVDSTDFYGKYEKRTEYDTLHSVTQYKYDMPKNISFLKEGDRSFSRGNEILYLNEQNQIILQTDSRRTVTSYKYNEQGLIIEYSITSDDPEFSAPEKHIFEYEYDDKENPICIKSYCVDDKQAKKPNEICIRHYEYKNR